MNHRAVLRETPDIIRDRCYIPDGRGCGLELQPEAHQEAIYLSPIQLRLFGTAQSCISA